MLAFSALFALLPLLAAAAPFEKRADNQLIRAGDRQDQCLTVTNLSNGGSVDLARCDTTDPNVKKLWNISRGDGLVRLDGTNLCLDAGSNPSNNVRAKVWECYPGLGNQQWYYTDDNRIAITGGSQCLDNGPAGPQTYQCTTGNTNQVWLSNTGGGPTPSSSASASASASVSSPAPSSSASSTPPPPAGAKFIHPYGDETLCVGADTFLGDGIRLIVNPCRAAGAPDRPNFLWDINRGDGKVRISGTNFCMDAGSNPANGGVAKIWTCYDGLPQQQWYYTDDNHLAITGGSQCLDVRAESGQSYQKPYGSLKDMQTWQCSGTDVNQVFTVTGA